MQVYSIIRSIFKVFLSLIGISVLLTSIIGGISIFQVFGSTDGIYVDPDDVDMSFGVAGNHFLIVLNFNNNGYFDFEDFTVNTFCSFQNKSDNSNHTILSQPLFQGTLEGGESYILNLEANESDFQTENLLQDNSNSWHDPDIQTLIDDGIVTESEVEYLSYPYLLWNYDVNYKLQMTSKYNLGLIEFTLDINFTIEYNAFFSTPYPTLKASFLGGL